MAVDNLVAFLDDYDVISVYLSKYYYEGKSSTFRLRDNKTGELTTLPITKTYDSRQSGFTAYKLAVEKPLNIGTEYDVLDAYGLSCPLIYGRIVRKEEFDKHFSCLDVKFGSIYTPEKTTFRVWAPTATKCKVEFVLDDRSHTHRMQRLDRGVFEATIEGDLDGASYTYLVKNSEKWEQSIDPYAYSSTSNAKRSVVINPEKIKFDLKKEKLSPLKKYTDAIIYEMSVRDFTWMKEVDFKHHGKFLGVVEEGVRLPNGGLAGLDYLKKLGITHVQLLPIADFATVDEDHPEVYYNWGYDPIQYSVPEGSYATSAKDGYTRIIELKQMIAKLHENGIRVIMDVVYNHMYNQKQTAFEKLVPSYYFRQGKNGEMSNGSYCGNDVASDRPMVRKFIVESCLRWVKEYGIDGFRFDLMGIIDIDTMNEIVEKCLKEDPNLMFYGEGWNMPTLIEDRYKSTIANHLRLNKIGFFNDRFRTVMRGPNGSERAFEKGYSGGNTYLTHDGALVMLGCDYLSDPWRSINYIECHDNETFWDKLKLSNNLDSRNTLDMRMKFANAVTILSLGVPFIHSGQEFCRTKNGEHNTYNRPDPINQINWFRKEQRIEQVRFVEDMIKVRKQFDCFRMATSQEVRAHCFIEEIDFRAVSITYNYDCGAYDKVKLLVNPSEKAYNIDLSDGKYDLISDMTGLVNKAIDTKDFMLLPVSTIVVARKKVQK